MRARAVAAALAVILFASSLRAAAQETGRELYNDACAACHGDDGRGEVLQAAAFETELPDFTDCSFATREADADWLAVVHDGGPARSFAEMMPAFGVALSESEIGQIIGHIRTFCTEHGWPPGELNLPRPLITEKAYPEDEAVLTASMALQDPRALMSELLYERRLGSRTQLEVVIPFGVRKAESADAHGPWTGGLGDIALGVKRVLSFARAGGTIVSAAAEVKFPTGSADRGFGTGTTVLEPLLLLGQNLPASSFLQAQAGLELPVKRQNAVHEAFWRGALGTTFVEGNFGRSWTPIVELLGARDLEAGARVLWDVVPQLQVSLNTRQHVLASIGARIPVDGSTRPKEVVMYLLWDWFDGGLFDGW
jgi:mono/diheme cytochrome c family protein